MIHESSMKSLTFIVVVQALKLKSGSWIIIMQKIIDAELKWSDTQQKILVFTLSKNKFPILYFME
jgi:hypothetical protein